MPSFATFGNELYTGKRSYNFVGAKKIWFLIAMVAVALSIVIPVVKGGFNLGIEFRGGSEFTVSNVKDTTLPSVKRPSKMLWPAACRAWRTSPGTRCGSRRTSSRTTRP